MITRWVHASSVSSDYYDGRWLRSEREESQTR